MAEIIRPDGATLHYEIMGGGAPVLCLAPGGVGSEISRWSDSALGGLESLAARFKVIAMDQRLAGSSRQAFATFTYEDALGDQLAVLEAAGEQSAHVLGDGIGAAYALRMAYDAPARVRNVCLIHPIGLAENNRIGDYYAPFNETIRLARAEGIDAVIDAAVANPSFIENPGAGPWAQRLHDQPAFRDALRSLGRELYITLVVDTRDCFYPWGRSFFSINDVAVARIAAPMLVIAGQDDLHPAAVAERLANEAPNARLASAQSGTELAQLVTEHFMAK